MRMNCISAANDTMNAIRAVAEERSELFTTKEIEMATGLKRGTITNRAHLLGFERTGRGYTKEQVFDIVTYGTRIHRADKQKARQLRSYLREMLDEEGLPIAIVSDDGDNSLAFY